MRRALSWMLVLVAVVAFTHTATFAKRPGESSNDELYRELELFEHALAIVRADYVEEPAAKDLIYGALKGMLATLDPYSQFLDPDSYTELKVDTEGVFGGLGIEITIRDDVLTVITPIDGTPAYHAGVEAGDRIVKIDGELTRGITLLEAVKKLRGKPQTTVQITILREGANELKDFDIERAIIKIESVREAAIVDAHIGYVRLSDFRERTIEDLRNAVNELRAQDMEGLILDLRNNPGGLLDSAISVSELFLKRDDIIVTTKGRLRNQNLEFRARTNGLVTRMPLVVMINQGSASASEIVAGAIQDHDRGIVLGMKSHGKGSVQTVFPLKDGSALRLTTSKWYTPSGRPIHGEGIIPDVEVPFERRTKDEEESKADEIFTQLEPAEDATKRIQAKRAIDNQLARAVDLLKGIQVYQRQGNVLQ